MVRLEFIRGLKREITSGLTNKGERIAYNRGFSSVRQGVPLPLNPYTHKRLKIEGSTYYRRWALHGIGMAHGMEKRNPKYKLDLKLYKKETNTIL